MKGPVLLTLLLGILFSVIHGLILFLFDVDASLVPAEEPTDAKVHFMGAHTGELGEMLELEMHLRDSAPLFMPTPYNAASDLSGLGRLQDAAEAFSAFEPELLLPSETFPEIPRHLPDLNPGKLVPGDSSFLLSRFQGRPVGPNRANGPTDLLLVARCLDCPDPVESRHYLKGIDFELAPQGVWQPLVAYLHLVQGRPTGPPLLSARSGYPAWDAYLFDQIRRAAPLPGLDNGYYQIILEP